MKHRYSVTKPVSQSNTAKRHTKTRGGASIALALTVMFGSLTACGLTGPAADAPSPVEESATAPEEAPTPAEEPGSGTEEPGSGNESASNPGTEPTGNEQGENKELLDEAEKIFREYHKAAIEMLTLNKSPRGPDWLKKYGTGKFYTDMLGVIAQHNKANYRLEDGAAKKITAKVRSIQSPGDEGVIKIEACTDMTRANVVDKSTGKQIKKAAFIFQEAKMKRVYKTFKIFRSKSTTVTKCPF